MANRFPLVLDTTDGNKIKELPDGDNLDLTNSNIISVNDVNSTGTIRASELLVRGSPVKPVGFSDLIDTPNSFAGAANFFAKVNSTEDGIEYRSLSDLGTINVDSLVASNNITPSSNDQGNIGTDDAVWNRIRATNFVGNLVSESGSIVFNASDGLITYAAIAGAPTQLSEFTDDIGYLKVQDLDSTLSSLFGGTPFVSDIQGSVFGSDSSIIIDGDSSLVVGNIENQTTTSTQIIAGNIDSTNVTVTTNLELLGSRTSNLTMITPITGASGLTLTTSGDVQQELINIQPAATGEVNIQADNIRLIGDISEPITASGGFVGDLIGSVVSDNSTVIIDGVAGKLVTPTIAGPAFFEDDVVVNGNLTIQGTTTTVDTENTTITDNVIVLNQNETGAGVTAGASGIEIDRGSESNKTLVWDETDDKWTVGSETFAANTFEAVGFQGAFFGNGGLNSPLQLSSGLEGQTGNTIFINPQGSDTLVQMWGETINLVTGPFNTYDSPYVQFKTEGAFKAHQGAYFDGNLIGNVTGDIVGSIFADDSSVMVDAVSNNLNSVTATISTITTSTINSNDGENISVGGNFGGYNYNDSTGEAQVISTGTVSIEGAATAAVNIGTGTSGTVTIGHASNTIEFPGTIDLDGTTVNNASFNLTGNIDNTTLALGATATTINVGHADSTTNLIGDVSFSSALFVNNITADNSIQITTAEGTNNGITLSPQGTNTSINLLADEIRLSGTPFSDTLNAIGGIVGDVKGSITGDDSTILVDAVNNIIPKAVVEDSNNWDTAYSWGDHSAAGYATITTLNAAVANSANWDTAYSWGDHSTAGYLTSGGSFTGDVQGSVFADDSSPMVDATNYTMFSDTMSLTPLAFEPENPINGMLAVADGTGWDPATNGKNTLVAYLGGAWVIVAAAA